MRVSLLLCLFALLLVACPARGEVPVSVARYTGPATDPAEVRAADAAQWQPADALRRQPAPSFWRLQLERAPAGGEDVVIALREAFEAPLLAYLPPDYAPQPLSTFDPA